MHHFGKKNARTPGWEGHSIIQIANSATTRVKCQWTGEKKTDGGKTEGKD